VIDSSFKLTKSTSRCHSNGVKCKALNKNHHFMYSDFIFTSTVTGITSIYPVNGAVGHTSSTFNTNCGVCTENFRYLASILTPSHPFSCEHLFERSLRGVRRNYWSRDTSATVRMVNISHLTANRVARPILLKRERCNGCMRSRVHFESGVAGLSGKGKAITLQTLTGPEGSTTLRPQNFMTIGTWRW
jgi:hypothetical protein